jgi:hypothetical protein
VSKPPYAAYRFRTTGRLGLGEHMQAARDKRALRHTVETLTEEIGRIVAERQELRAAGAGQDALEENRRRLADAQNRLSRLLIARYAA